MNFADKLQVLRKSNGMTQDVLAEKLQISRQAVARWETGVSFPDVMHLIQIGEMFHVTLDYLLKEPSCDVNAKRSFNQDTKEMLAFRVEAIKNTYAGYGDEIKPSRTASHDYQYKNGKYEYYDTWIGGFSFSGEEAVWYD